MRQHPGSPGAHPKKASEVAREVIRRMEERVSDPRAVWGIPWGLPGLDKLTGGIHSPELAILTARPSVGKTQMMVQMADSVFGYFLSEDGQREYPGGMVKLVLCESTAEVFYRRWACMRSGVSQRMVRDGSIGQSPEKMSRFYQAMEEITSPQIEILDDAQTLEQVVSFLKSGRTAWWALDYVQKCPLTPNRPNDGGVAAITLISGALTEVAKLKAPGLALAHTPREVDKREDRRPRLGDIKGGSALEGDARVVMGLYREAVYERMPEDGSQQQAQNAELILLKNNDGDSGVSIPLLFYPRRGIFQDLSNVVLADDDDAVLGLSDLPDLPDLPDLSLESLKGA